MAASRSLLVHALIRRGSTRTTCTHTASRAMVSRPGRAISASRSASSAEPATPRPVTSLRKPARQSTVPGFRSHCNLPGLLGLPPHPDRAKVRMWRALVQRDDAVRAEACDLTESCPSGCRGAGPSRLRGTRHRYPSYRLTVLMHSGGGGSDGRLRHRPGHHGPIVAAHSGVVKLRDTLLRPKAAPALGALAAWSQGGQRLRARPDRDGQQPRLPTALPKPWRSGLVRRRQPHGPPQARAWRKRSGAL